MTGLKQTVCRQIVELAQDHGARAIAQGVETRADFLAAHGMGFDLVQGYLFSKPIGVKKFARSRPVLPSPAGSKAVRGVRSGSAELHQALARG